MSIGMRRMTSLFRGDGTTPRRTPYQFSFGESQEPEPIGAKVNFRTPWEPMSPIEQAPEQSDSSRFYDEVQRLRGQEGPGVTAYRRALGEMPNPADYNPGKFTRVAAGLAGISAGLRDAGRGVETAMRLNRAPYEAAMDEYGTRLGGLKEQAYIEREDAKARADALTDAAKLGLSYKDYELKVRKQESDEEMDRLQRGTARTTAEAALVRAQTAARADYEYTPVQGGFMIQNKHDPNDPQNGLIIRAATTQDAANAVARTNAQANASRAATAAGQLALDEKYRGREVAAREDSATAALQGARDRGNTPATPAAQDKARELAETEMMNDPKWAEFFKGKPRSFLGMDIPGTESDTRVGPQDFDDPQDWADFQIALKARIDKIIAGQPR